MALGSVSLWIAAVGHNLTVTDVGFPAVHRPCTSPERAPTAGVISKVQAATAVRAASSQMGSGASACCIAIA